MGYYQTFIDKQKRLEQERIENEKKEINKANYQKYKDRDYYKKSNQRAKDWYWRNREYVLERQKQKNYNNSEYYKDWYQKNKVQLNQIRYGDRSGTRTYKPLLPVPKIIPKPKSFILFG